MDPALMDVMFCREDNLFFQVPDFVKIMTDQEKKELILFIKQIIEKKLTQCQRETIELYFFRGKTEAEIAKILNRHQTTISQHLRYGLKKIRKHLKKADFLK